MELARLQGRTRKSEQANLDILKENTTLRKSLEERRREQQEEKGSIEVKKLENSTLKSSMEGLKVRVEELSSRIIHVTTEKETLGQERDSLKMKVEQLQTSLGMVEEKAKKWAVRCWAVADRVWSCSVLNIFVGQVREANLVKLLEDVELKSERLVMIVEETEKEKALVQASLDAAERKLTSGNLDHKALVARLRREVADLEQEKVCDSRFMPDQILWT